MARRKFGQRPYTLSGQSVLLVVSLPYAVLIARQSTIETAKPQRPILRSLHRDDNICGEVGLIAPETLALSRLWIVADHALIVGSQPPVAVSIFRDAINIAYFPKFKDGKIVPRIGRTILVGTHPERAIGIQHQGIQRVFRQRRRIVLIILERQAFLRIPVEHHQAVVVGGNPQAAVIIFPNVAHEDMLQRGFCPVGLQPLRHGVKPLLQARRVDLRHSSYRHPVVAPCVNKQFVIVTLGRMMIWKVSANPKRFPLMGIQAHHRAVVVNQYDRSINLRDVSHRAVGNVISLAAHFEKERFVCLGVKVITSLAIHHRPDILPRIYEEAVGPAIHPHAFHPLFGRTVELFSFRIIDAIARRRAYPEQSVLVFMYLVNAIVKK